MAIQWLHSWWGEFWWKKSQLALLIFQFYFILIRELYLKGLKTPVR